METFKVFSNPLCALVLLRKCLSLSHLKGSDSLSVCSLNAPLCGGLQRPQSANPLFPAVFQAPAAGHRVHEAPEQSGQHRPGDRQSRHVNAGGEGLLQTTGTGLLPLPRAPIPGTPSPGAPVPLVAPPAGLCRQSLAGSPAHSSGCSSERSRLAAG